MAAALGLRARTGSAALVAVAGSLDEPVLVESSRIPLLPDGQFAPYHAVEDLPAGEADRKVKKIIATAHRMAEEGMREALGRCAKSGHPVRGCGVLVGKGMPEWSTAEIIAVHFRMHKAEGELFRDVLVAAAKACKLPLAKLPDKSAVDSAAVALGIKRARIEAALAKLGKMAGPPWRSEQKEAAVAALVALERGSLP